MLNDSKVQYTIKPYSIAIIAPYNTYLVNPTPLLFVLPFFWTCRNLWLMQVANRSLDVFLKINDDLNLFLACHLHRSIRIFLNYHKLTGLRGHLFIYISVAVTKRRFTYQKQGKTKEGKTRYMDGSYFALKYFITKNENYHLLFKC